MVEVNDRRNRSVRWNPSTPVSARRTLENHIDSGQRVLLQYGEGTSGPMTQGYLTTDENGHPSIKHSARSKSTYPILESDLQGVTAARKNRDRSRSVLWQKE